MLMTIVRRSAGMASTAVFLQHFAAGVGEHGCADGERLEGQLLVKGLLGRGGALVSGSATPQNVGDATRFGSRVVGHL